LLAGKRPIRTLAAPAAMSHRREWLLVVRVSRVDSSCGGWAGRGAGVRGLEDRDIGVGPRAPRAPAMGARPSGIWLSWLEARERIKDGSWLSRAERYSS